MKQNAKCLFGMVIFPVRILGTDQGHTTKTATRIKFLGMKTFVAKFHLICFCFFDVCSLSRTGVSLDVGKNPPPELNL